MNKSNQFRNWGQWKVTRHAMFIRKIMKLRLEFTPLHFVCDWFIHARENVFEHNVNFPDLRHCALHFMNMTK